VTTAAALLLRAAAWYKLLQMACSRSTRQRRARLEGGSAQGLTGSLFRVRPYYGKYSHGKRPAIVFETRRFSSIKCRFLYFKNTFKYIRSSLVNLKEVLSWCAAGIAYRIYSNNINALFA
jgi:hypothetical protein